MNGEKGIIENATSEVENLLKRNLENKSRAGSPALISVVSRMQEEIDNSKREIAEWKRRVEYLEKAVARLIKSNLSTKGEQTFTQHMTENGRVYYCNVVTGESIWELPDCACVE